MAYAIIEAGGKQFRVEPGRFYDINRLALNEDDAITFDQVLFVENDGEVSIGQPLVEGATISGTVMRHLRGRKIIVYKMRPKKKTRKKQGHRQDLTRVMINSITLNGTTIGGNGSGAAAAPEPEPVEADVEAIAETTEDEQP